MIQYQAVLAGSHRGELVLTVNKRLARHLQQLFTQQMEQRNARAWTTPTILSLDSWLLRCLAGTGRDGRLLPQFALQRLWEEVIESDLDAQGFALLQVPLAARQAAEANRLLEEYGAEPTAYPLSDDHLAFLRWQRSYRRRLEAGGWLDDTHLTKLICQGLLEGAIPSPKTAWLVGFDEIGPRVARLCAALRESGCTVQELPPAHAPAGECQRWPAPDAAGEVRAAARWARGLLETGQERIGIVVTDLHQYRPLVERIFLEELDPGALLRLSDEEDCFSLSLGESLGEQGAVTAALALLGAGPSLTLDQASQLLRSPYLGGSLAEGHSRARLERALRSLRSPRFSRNRMKTLGLRNEGRFAGCACPQFVEVLEALERGEGRGRRPAGEWALLFSQTLEAAGWPGDRPLSSREFQVVKSWHEKVLSGLMALDGVSAPLDRPTALFLLRRLAMETPFQPEGQGGPLQVVGLLEAAGLAFDHLWVMGLSEEALPAPAKPNPFLPPALQIACAMPHAGADRELAFARQVLARLSAAAPRVIFSYPGQQGDCHLRPSPLIAALPLSATLELPPSHHPVSLLRRRPPTLESRPDLRGPALAPGALAAGGTGILRDQALCPFRAFAHHRLGARGLDAPQPGLDPVTRGTLLHRCLEQFWRSTRGLAGLLELDDAALDQRLEQSVAAALAEELAERPQELASPLIAIESRRLLELVREWLLGVECRRAPFEVVALEQPHQAEFGGLVIQTQVDRIDRLGDGTEVILDYKTGRNEVADLIGERLLEPQLPIYATHRDGVEKAAIAFALVRRGECGFKGVARASGLLPGVNPLAENRLAQAQGLSEWPQLLDRWQQQLEELGRAFVAGAAAVAPVDAKKACQFCDLAAFCRIAEAALLPEEEE